MSARTPRARWVLLAAVLCAACTSTPPAPADVARDGDDATVGTDVAAPDVQTQQPVCNRTSGRPAGYVEPTFPGLRAAVQMYRDALGIPHLFAQNDDDLFFASGYMQAVDRLFQMDVMRRTASGTASEVFGRDKLGQDQMIRLVNIPRWGRETVDRLRTEQPEVFRLVVAWVAGVNRRVDEIRNGTVPRPPGFRASEFDYEPTRWTVDDPLIVTRLLTFRNANQLEFDILASIFRSLVPTAADLPLFQSLNDTFALPPEERPTTGGSSGAAAPPARSAPGASRAPRPGIPADFAHRMRAFRESLAVFRSGGSNNWAVAGRHTDNGRPLIAGDPHQALQSPSVFWAQHLHSASSGGTFDVAGWAFVGTPGVSLGHNRHIAWTATTIYPDMMDLWEVRAASGQVTLGTQQLPLERCTEVIPVRGESPVEHVVEEVPGRGVLLPRNFTPVPITRGTNRLLFGWTGFRPTREADAFFAISRARSVAEFEAAVDRMDIGAFHFIGADARDISYRVRVMVPDRGSPRDLPTPNALLDGADPRTLWSGAMIPPERLPASRGGTRGYLASANNDPLGFTSNGRIDDDPWYFGVWFDPGARAQRIESELSRLTQAGGVTRAQMQSLQMDTHVVIADELLPSLADAVSRIDTDPALAMYRGDAGIAQLASQLAGWNRRADRDSSAAVVYEAWVSYFAREVLADDFGLVFDPVFEGEPVYVHKVLALTVNQRFLAAERLLQGGRAALALRALAQTRDWLTTRFGGIEPSRYRWDQYHRSRYTTLFSPAGPFDAPPLATGGTTGTVNVSQALFFEGANTREFHESTGGAAYRMVAGFREDGTPEAEINFGRGNSGDPTSPNFADRAEEWANGTYRRLLFERAEIEANAVESRTIAP